MERTARMTLSMDAAPADPVRVQPVHAEAVRGDAGHPEAVETRAAGTRPQTGVEEALGALYEIHGRALFYYALALTGSREDAEDAVQEVFVNLARGGSRLLRIGNPQGYLVRATRNAAYSILRGRRRRGDLEQALSADESQNRCVSLHSSTGDFSPQDSDRPEGRVLRDRFARLPVEQREVLALKVFQGLTFKEIAKATGISINTAASRYRYGIEKLRVALEGRK